ncbi:diguanylate cyclase [Paraliomyxa miuraensis]|uniref:diguanylate cyclase n=1 Tax=Paraliomyxa miuraensis TaxID=376150 RepID=UPI00224E9B9A|nr:diguanylate cyclase [Paraliomyxa miuraensis]MCX4244849.1 diguanylate cyclase [Paraliomyxa miuraensis]
MSSGSRQHVVLGLLTDALDATYQSTVLRGAAEAAREHGAGLRCFATGVLRSSLPASAQRNVLLDMVGPHNVDALIVMAGALANEVGIEALDDYLGTYRSLPICSVAVELPNAFSVLVNNEGGVWSAMRHLVEDCQRRRVAFVRGPATNAEAESRYRAYLDAVARLGLPIEPALVVRGDFTRASGAVAGQALLDSGAQPDAILVADDLMAMGVLDTLMAREIAVPEDVAVVGFNDIEESRFASVPLTTIRQPLYEQGKRAALALLATLRGDPPSGRIVLATELVKRRSSGLRHIARGDEPEASISALGTAIEEALTTRREEALAEMRHALVTPVHSVGATWAPRLLDAFTHELTGNAPGSFAQTVREVASHALRVNTDGASLQDVISILRRETLSCIAASDRERLQVENLCEEARITIAELVEHAQAHQRLQVQAWARSLGQTITALISTFDVVTLVEGVAEQFPRLGINSCYLSLYTNGTKRARLLLALDAFRPTLKVEGQPEFDARDLVPPGLLGVEPRTFVVENLFFGEEQLGLALFEFGPREGVIYEALRDQISAALKGALLVQEVLEKDRERQRLMQDLEARARQLERAYKALQEGQRRMLVSESMSSLGQMSVRCRPLAELYADILGQLASLLGSEHAFIALLPAAERVSLLDAPVLVGEAGSPSLTVFARSGRFSDQRAVDDLPPSLRQAIHEVVRTHQSARLEDGVVLPLVAGEQALGVVYVESGDVTTHDLELLGTFANQATAAINNARLYQMAAQDPLTEVHARRFFDQWMPREVEAALRTRRPLGVLMVDMDDMKSINDNGGHLAGDRALMAVGRVLRSATRDHDVIARYGGDEFALILPDGDREGVTIVARRILGNASIEMIEGVGQLRCSLGGATLVRPPDPLTDIGTPLDSRLVHAIVEQLVGAADEALYEAKARGGAELGTVREVGWPKELFEA